MVKGVWEKGRKAGSAPATLSALSATMMRPARARALAGRAAMARVDEFFAEHGIQPGVGAQKLQGEDVPERHRIIFTRLLAEFPVIEQRVQELDPTSKTPAPVSVSARAVGSRYRI